MRRIIFGVLFVIIVVLALWRHDRSIWTPQAAEQVEIRKAVTKASTTAAKKSGQVYSTMNAGFTQAGDVNTRTLRDTLMPRAIKANEIRQNYEEAIATTNGQTIRDPRLFVDATIPTWQWHIVFEGPLTIVATEHTSTDSGVGHFENITPDGIQKAKGLRGKKWDGSPQFPLPVDIDSIHMALIGRVCDGPNCTEPFFIGSGRVLCPDTIGMTGWVELKVNQHELLFHGNEGGYSFSHRPAPSVACE